MKIAGIIAEYNPFHKGHAYHIVKTREQTGADYVVVIQSGNFVQRGAPALVDKHCRAKMALLGGADLVLELPSVYACSSAESFAGGAVSLMNRLGCVDVLSFGSECGDLTALCAYSKVLAEEPAAYQDLLRAFLKQGLSFPLARSKALQEYFSYGQDILPCSLYDCDCRYESEILSQPNNTLGIEYLKAMILSGSPMEAITISRHSSGYHDISMDAEFASATAIRDALISGAENISTQIPSASYETLESYLKQKQPLTLDDFSDLLYYRILTLSEEELALYTDVTPELASRMKKLLPEFRSFSSYADLLKTKQITHTRITRALFHVLLADKQEEAVLRKVAGYPSYARILGFRRESQPLLSKIKDVSSLPLISRMADGARVLEQYAKDHPETSLLPSLFSQELTATQLYEACVAFKSKTAICHEFTRQMTVL